MNHTIISDVLDRMIQLRDGGLALDAAKQQILEEHGRYLQYIQRAALAGVRPNQGFLAWLRIDTLYSGMRSAAPSGPINPDELSRLENLLFLHAGGNDGH